MAGFIRPFFTPDVVLFFTFFITFHSDTTKVKSGHNDKTLAQNSTTVLFLFQV
jgi:hypothetical protein